MHQDQTVSEMAEEVLTRQAKALAYRSGHSLEDARRACFGSAPSNDLCTSSARRPSGALQPNATLDAARASHVEGLGGRSERAGTLVE